jgi:peptidoglycan/xylan/chitin deacetylase (PgdA/CDA1 family)
MNIVALIYHDVTVPGQGDSSGRLGPGPALYKLDVADFDNHLDALDGVDRSRRGDVAVALAQPDAGHVLLTFDDGGASAATEIAPSLEAHGWRGHFFVTSREIGRPGYLDASGIRALADAGHTVGSHSASHPDLFAALPPAAQAAEWRESTALLGDILGKPVRTGSVPGGLFDDTVARVAAECGLTALFTSEPRARAWREGSCAVFGRFSITRRTSAADVGDLVFDRRWRRQRAAAFWSVKRAVRAVGGERYLRARRALLGVARRPGDGRKEPR